MNGTCSFLYASIIHDTVRSSKSLLFEVKDDEMGKKEKSAFINCMKRRENEEK
jgi:hypothetical protein